MDGIDAIEISGNNFKKLNQPTPYFLENALKSISEIDILSDRGIIICERPAEKALETELPGLTRGKDYRYGKTWITLFRKG